MTSFDTVQANGFFNGDTWAWWQARRLRYNITLAAGGWIAYFLIVALNYAFGHPVWRDSRNALGITLYLGVGYLIIMGVANVFYLLGPAVEAWVKPRDVDRYRRNAFAMGNWGSLIVPLSCPLLQLGILIANS